MMRTARAERVVAALKSAAGKSMTAMELHHRTGIDPRKVPTAVCEARDFMQAPIETVKPRGSGWRLPADWNGAPASTPEPAPGPPPEPVPTPLPAKPAVANQAAPLSRRAAAMLACLQRAGGKFVAGRVLAAVIGTDIDQLSIYAKELRAKHPELEIYGKRGSGYCLGAPADCGPVLVAPRTSATLRDTLDLLALLSPAAAERVRDIALESGQSAAAVIERLIWYGAEVHRDLVASGEHPLQLGRAA